jgi:hypothetical protein
MAAHSNMLSAQCILGRPRGRYNVLSADKYQAQPPAARLQRSPAHKLAEVSGFSPHNPVVHFCCNSLPSCSLRALCPSTCTLLCTCPLRFTHAVWQLTMSQHAMAGLDAGNCGRNGSGSRGTHSSSGGRPRCSVECPNVHTPPSQFQVAPLFYRLVRLPQCTHPPVVALVLLEHQSLIDVRCCPPRRGQTVLGCLYTLHSLDRPALFRPDPPF